MILSLKAEIEVTLALTNYKTNCFIAKSISVVIVRR